MHELGRTCRASDRLVPHRSRGFMLVYAGVGEDQEATLRERLVDAVRRAGQALLIPALVDSVDLGLASAPPSDALRRAEHDLRSRRIRRRMSQAGTAVPVRPATGGVPVA